MILTVCGIFILAFAVGYWGGGIHAERKKKRAAAERKSKLSALPPEEARREKLN